jgi:hypothetical protein
MKRSEMMGGLCSSIAGAEVETPPSELDFAHNSLVEQLFLREGHSMRCGPRLPKTLTKKPLSQLVETLLLDDSVNDCNDDNAMARRVRRCVREFVRACLLEEVKRRAVSKA